MIPLTDNLILNIRKAGMDNTIYVVYLDEYTFDYYYEQSFTQIGLGLDKKIKSKYCEYGTRDFRNITMKKFPAIKLVMEITNQSVFYMDSDIGISKNFNPYFKNKDFDMYCSVENDGTFCAGFIYLNNTKRTFEFIDKHIKISNQIINRIKYFDDQSILNNLVSNAIIAPLRESDFSNGYNQTKGKYTTHVNCIRGIDKKIELLKRLGLFHI